jgi:hypothetical protein
MFSPKRAQRAAVLFPVCLALVGVGCGPTQPTKSTDDDMEMKDLIKELGELKVEGVSRGGPYVGVAHNDVTRRIVAKGDAVPPLVRRLDHSSCDESVYIVFCLRQLKAGGAKGRVLQLEKEAKEGRRFEGERNVFTLEMQIQYFLRDVEGGGVPGAGDADRREP